MTKYSLVRIVGPQYETVAEARMLSTIGGSAVGMSTTMEVCAAVHCGFDIIMGLSLITNELLPSTTNGSVPQIKEPNHEEVLEVSMVNAKEMSRLIENLIYLLP